MKGNFKFTNQYNDSQVIVLLDKLFLVEIYKKEEEKSNKSKVHLTGNGGEGAFDILDTDLEEFENVIGPDVRIKGK